LIVSGDEVFVLAFVFPAEESLLPHVGPSLAATMLGCAFFEREVFASRIGLRGLRMIEDFAEIEKVLL
jgi:hypothetical protein